MLVFLQDGSAQKIVLAATPRWKFANQTCHPTLSLYIDIRPTVPALTLQRQAPTGSPLEYQLRTHWGAGIAQLVVCWVCYPAWCSVVGLIFLWASGRWDVSLGFNMGSGPFSPKTLPNETINQGSLCTHAFHRTDSYDPDIHVLDGWMPATKHTQHAPSTKTECDYFYGWIKKR